MLIQTSSFTTEGTNTMLWYNSHPNRCYFDFRVCCERCVKKKQISSDRFIECLHANGHLLFLFSTFQFVVFLFFRQDLYKFIYLNCNFLINNEQIIQAIIWGLDIFLRYGSNMQDNIYICRQKRHRHTHVWITSNCQPIFWILSRNQLNIELVKWMK